MKTFKQYLTEEKAGDLYTAYKIRDNDFDPGEFGLPPNINKIIGAGAESIAVTSDNPNDPVYKISKFNPNSFSNDKKRDPNDVLARREQKVKLLQQIEKLGYITILDVVMHYSTYRRMKEEGKKPNFPKGTYYQKGGNEPYRSSFVIERKIPIADLHTEILPGGIIKQDKTDKEFVDYFEGDIAKERLVWREVQRVLKEKGIPIDNIRGKGNFMWRGNELAVVDI